jgi:hypothetical protein
MIEFLGSAGVDRVLEIGPGRVLVGVVARVSRDLARASLGIAKEIDTAAEFAAGQRVSRSEPKASEDHAR